MSYGHGALRGAVRDDQQFLKLPRIAIAELKKGLASGRGHGGIKFELLEYGENVFDTLPRQSAEIPWAQVGSVSDRRQGRFDYCIRSLPCPVKIGAVNVCHGVLRQPLSGLFGFLQTLFVQRYVHPAAQSFRVVQRVENGFAVAHQY
jgi:hypothetical protein